MAILELFAVSTCERLFALTKGLRETSQLKLFTVANLRCVCYDCHGTRNDEDHVLPSNLDDTYGRR